MESAGTAGTAQQIVDDAAKAMQAGAKSFATGHGNPLVQRALSATGALVFGSQAVQVCSEQGISADCLLTSPGHLRLFLEHGQFFLIRCWTQAL